MTAAERRDEACRVIMVEQGKGRQMQAGNPAFGAGVQGVAEHDSAALFQQRQREVGRVRAIVADELEQFRAERSAREVAPVVTALRFFSISRSS